ncbi:probable E3 ubiquitin-protein ligase HECTD2 [Ptychodera flava]|uniref:probable E3 ubiquitin-protein ligase HECTD2 n=1 Tax=Ptychodera flava TaxID=63121 RepID=UPI00396AA70C
MTEDVQFAIPTGRPPRSTSKRGSLPASVIHADISRLKLGRHSSQPKLNKNVGSGSFHNLTSVRSRSNSLVPLADLKKTLSASNLAALSDSNLSIQEALPPRSYDAPNTTGAMAKTYFEQLVKRYFYQLTEGCGNKKCRNKFCFSAKDHLKSGKDVAAIVSIELASRKSYYLCGSEKFIGRGLPSELFDGKPGTSKPFLHSMFSCTPFASLFKDKPLHPKIKLTTPSSLSSLTKDLLPTPSVGANSKLSISSGAIPKLRPVQSGSNSHSELRTKNHSIVKDTATDFLDSGGISGKLVSRSTSCSMENVSSATSNYLSRQFSAPLDSTCSSLGSVSMNSALLLSSDAFNTTMSSLTSTYLLSSNEALADNLEEFENQCALEMSGGAEEIKEFSLTHLTVTMLETAIEKYKELKDPSFLVNTIRTVFTSSDALNASFKVNDLDADSAVDISAVRTCYDLLLNIQPSDVFHITLTNAVEIVLTSLQSAIVQPQDTNQLIILLENPLVQSNSKLLQKLCRVLAQLTDSKKVLVKILAEYSTDDFEKLVRVFVRHLSTALKPKQGTQPNLMDVCRALSVLHEANNHAYLQRGEGIVPMEEFYSKDLSRRLDYRAEFEIWREKETTPSLQNGHKERNTSLLEFPFLLDPASKVHILHLESVVQMRQEYQDAILHQARVNQAQKYYREALDKSADLEDAIKSAMCPFLVFEVTREDLIKDTLAQIRLKQSDLKKPLKIKFVGGGEQGLDLGGLQKEFFQLITESIFDPNYGMFTYLEESRMLWINGASFESQEEFELVGIILGLAIYNGIILDIHFPTTIYKKLQGEDLDLQDLMEFQPSLGRGLKELLEYEDEVEFTFCQTFQISYQSMGEMVTVDLVPNGSEVPVTNQNRTHFVDLYLKHLLEDNIATQFEAFARGFHLVCGGEALKLFCGQEIELLICGSPDLDFKALELSTTYDDGFTKQHPTIKAFWSVIHSLDEDQKKKLLNFITGSDRVPLKGLSSLPVVIQRNGPDSDRLPTAMTCFNRLLLPSYATRDKLKERLLTAIENGKGFGLT